MIFCSQMLNFVMPSRYYTINKTKRNLCIITQWHGNIFRGSKKRFARRDVGSDDFSEKRSSSKTITLLRPRSTSYIDFIRDYHKKKWRSSVARSLIPGASHCTMLPPPPPLSPTNNFQAFAEYSRNAVFGSRYSLRNSIPAYLLLMQIEIERFA